MNDDLEDYFERRNRLPRARLVAPRRARAAARLRHGLRGAEDVASSPLVMILVGVAILLAPILYVFLEIARGMAIR